MTALAKWGPTALIVGGSGGIGAAMADRLAADGIDLVLIGRTEGTLAERRDEIRSRHDVYVDVLSCDMAEPDAVRNIIARTRSREIGLVAYIAGAVRPTAFLQQDVSEAMATAQINSIAPLQLFHHFAADMQERGCGGLLLVSSMAGLAGSANFATYSAAKAFGQMLMEGLWAELAPHGLDVLSLIASATDTPSSRRLGMDFDQLDPRFLMQPDEVAEVAFEQLPIGPTAWAGEHNFRAAEAFCTRDRRAATELMSARLNRLLTTS